MGDHTAPVPFWKDALERVGWTAVEAGAGALVGVTAFGVDELKAAGIAALIAAFGAIKVIAATRLGRAGSASIGA